MPAGERRRGQARAPGMEPLARLPVFLALKGRRAVLAGEGPEVAWKAELLSAAGAEVEVCTEHLCEELRAVAARPPAGAIALHRRAWRESDLRGAVLAIGGFDDEEEAKTFARAARAAGVPVNVIDRPRHCDFTFGAIVNRSPLVIGISTDGAAPVFAQAIRTRLEAMIPRGFARWADAARRWRGAIQASELSVAARRCFWRAFTRLAFADPGREPAPSDFEALLAQTRTVDMAAVSGAITLVGVGTGDPELLTLRALRALQTADVILLDGHIPPDILDFARREARKTVIGASTLAPSSNGDANALAVVLAKAGKRVLRLSAGEIAGDGAGKQIAAARAAGVAVEVVPGVAAARQDARTQPAAERPMTIARPLAARSFALQQGLSSPGRPLRACCEWPAARRGGRAPAP